MLQSEFLSGGASVTRFFKPLLLFFMVVSVIAIWGVGALIGAEEISGKIPPWMQFVLFLTISLMSVALLTIFIQMRRKGESVKDDSGKH